MAEYPDDGRLHPDLSDLTRDVLQALAEAWPGIMLWAVFAITIFQYPDWRDIAGYSLIACGILTLIRLRCYKETHE